MSISTLSTSDSIRNFFNQTFTTVFIAIYLVLLGCLFCSRIAFKLIGYSIRFLRRPFNRHVLFNILLRRRRIFGPLTRGKLLIVILYWVANIVCNCVGVQGLGAVGARAGRLAVANMIPILLAEKLWLGADVLRLSIHDYQTIHRNVGFMTLVQTAVHFGTFVARQQLPTLKSDDQTYALIGGIAVLLASITFVFANQLFELASIIHRTAAITIMTCLWLHVARKAPDLQPYIITTFACFASSFLYRIGRIAFRHAQWHDSRFNAIIRHHDGWQEYKEVVLEVSRPWKVAGGEVIYLWIPGVSFWSFLQTHPFMVCWHGVFPAIGSEDETPKSGTLEERDVEDCSVERQSRKLTVIMRKRDGWTRRLSQLADGVRTPALIDGPYGRSLGLEEYGTLIFILEEIGIVGALTHIQALLTRHLEGRARVRRIKVIWQVPSTDVLWIKKACDAALSLDDSRLLRFHLYSTHPGSFTTDHESSRIKSVTGRKMKIENGQDVVAQELRKRVGKTLFLVSTYSPLRDAVQDRISTVLNDQVEFQKLDYQPQKQTSIWIPEEIYRGDCVIESP